ncbi:MAG: phosphodiester glycosidase family protein [Treponema sp.]|nr:phosphodiester glycosidase family protein [Treponema sp.]
MNFKATRHAVIIIIVLLLSTAQAAEHFLPRSFAWKKVCNGVERFDFSSQSVPVTYHVVKIDLTAGFQLKSFPDSKDFSTLNASSYTPVKTKEFAKKNKCIVAFNGSPFIKKDKKHVYLAGIHKKDGIVFSKPNNKYAALAFTKDLKAVVLPVQTEENCLPYEHVFGGFYPVLIEGEEQTFKAETFDSRCGAGVSKDGKTLYILVAEGEQSNISTGLSYQQCARIFKAMGCYSALEFDGGGSTQLCLNGKSVLTYVQIRPQANSIGFSY